MSKADRIKAKRRRARKIEIDKQRDLEARALIEDLDEGEEIFPVPDGEPAPEEPEEISKEYGEPEMYVGPTSFEEMDAMKEAHEKAMHVQEVTWSVQDLVRNILWSPMDPKEKSAKIQKVASEFEGRVGEAMAGHMKKDLELLQLEALIATDARHTSPLEKAGDFVKEKLSSGARESLDDGQFALVYEEDGKKVRKYPIHDKAHVRNALARCAQQIKAGGQAAADAKRALPKIRAAAKRMGIEMDMEKSAIWIEKDAKGDWRWIGRPSNNFIDWQKDIISKDAQKGYVTWLDQNPELAPVFLSWHTPGTARTNPVDFWMEHEGALIMSGVLTEDEAAVLFEMQKEVDLGMSYQALGLRLDPDDARVVTNFWIYEVSDLPKDKAANPFTTLETMTKEVGMDKLEYLTKIMGSEEKAKAYLEKTGQMQKQLTEAGITSKEQVEEPTAEETPETPATPPVPDVKAIMEQVAKEFDIEGLNAFVAQAQEDHEKVETLEALVKALQTSTEEKLAEMLEPPAAKFAWSRSARPTEKAETKLKKEKAEDEKLSNAAPGVPEDYWLSRVTNTVPVTETS